LQAQNSVAALFAGLNLMNTEYAAEDIIPESVNAVDDADAVL
jgi:hypothetical protein